MVELNTTQREADSLNARLNWPTRCNHHVDLANFFSLSFYFYSFEISLATSLVHLQTRCRRAEADFKTAEHWRHFTECFSLSLSPALFALSSTCIRSWNTDKVVGNTLKYANKRTYKRSSKTINHTAHQAGDISNISLTLTLFVRGCLGGLSSPLRRLPFFANLVQHPTQGSLLLSSI